MTMPLLKAFLKRSKSRKSIYGNIELLKMFRFDFLSSSKKCTTANVCIPLSDTDHRWNLKKYLLKTLSDCSSPICLTTGVQSNLLCALKQGRCHEGEKKGVIMTKEKLKNILYCYVLPYDRPPLSKKLWLGKKKVEDIFLHAWYCHYPLSVILFFKP